MDFTAVLHRQELALPNYCGVVTETRMKKPPKLPDDNIPVSKHTGGYEKETLLLSGPESSFPLQP